MAGPKNRPSPNEPRLDGPIRDDTVSEQLNRRWSAALAAIVVAGAVGQFFILDEAWHQNPFARVPLVDGREYWNWAGEIAAGRLIGTTPFMSAPLYPYLLGLVRALNGGLLTVYVLQAGLHLATVGLLAHIVARRFGAAVGLLSAALYVLLQEPAFFAGRVLNCTLQLFLVVLLWWALVRAKQRLTPGTWAAAGILLGLNCLANPPMLLALPLLTLWAWWQSSWTWRGLTAPAVLIGATFLAISPATLHNYKVSGEWIPISAQAGLTFAQGNAPGAVGTYTVIPGISTTREEQNADALRLFRQTTGKSGSWNAINRFFFDRGLDYWRSNPGAGLTLLGRKLGYFLAGQNASEIYYPALEIEQGLAPRLRVAPLPVAWLTLPALAGIIGLARRPRRFAPELVLFAVPVLAVVLFFYSPRYRLPAVPILVAVGTAALWAGRAWRAHPRRSLTVAAVFILGVASGPIGQAIGFDRLDASYQATFHHGLGKALSELGRADDAVAQFREAVRLKPNFVPASADLGNLLRQIGHADEALTWLRRAHVTEPENAVVDDQLARVLVALDRIDEALPYFQVAVRLRPDNADLHNNLASALWQTGDLEDARLQYLAAAQIDPTHVNTHLNLGALLHELNDDNGALAHLREAVRFDPRSAAAHVKIAKILAARGDVTGAIAALRRANELLPDDSVIANDLAWCLATTPGLLPAERGAALALARQASAQAGGNEPNVLDTLAAALAANGQYEEAIRTVEQAIARAEQRAVPELIPPFRLRLALYKAGSPYLAATQPAEP